MNASASKKVFSERLKISKTRGKVAEESKIHNLEGLAESRQLEFGLGYLILHLHIQCYHSY